MYGHLKNAVAVKRHTHPSTWLQWRHNCRDAISNHQPNGCVLNRLLRRRSQKTLKLLVTGLCGGNLPVTGEFPAKGEQSASNAEMFSFDDVIMLLILLAKFLWHLGTNWADNVDKVGSVRFIMFFCQHICNLHDFVGWSMFISTPPPDPTPVSY